MLELAFKVRKENIFTEILEEERKKKKQMYKL